MNQRDQEKARAHAKERMKYGMIGLFGGYLVASFGLAVAAPMLITEECRQLQARMVVDGTAHMRPDPETGKLSPEQEKLGACFNTYNTWNMFLPIGFMIAGNIAGHRYADKKNGPQPPQPK
jgi:hypothetical protein